MQHVLFELLNNSLPLLQVHLSLAQSMASVSTQGLAQGPKNLGSSRGAHRTKHLLMPVVTKSWGTQGTTHAHSHFCSPLHHSNIWQMKFWQGLPMFSRLALHMWSSHLSLPSSRNYKHGTFCSASGTLKFNAPLNDLCSPPWVRGPSWLICHQRSLYDVFPKI